MDVLHANMNLFPFIGAEHPFHAPIEHLRTQLIATPLFQDMKQKLSAGHEALVRMSMKAHPSSNSTLRLKGFSLSVQFKERSRSTRFQASTFFCFVKKGRIEAFEFPQDPDLTTLAAYFSDSYFPDNGPETSLECEVLRYYPRKRLTFRGNTAYKNAPVIGKFVGSNLQQTFNKLIKIHHAVSNSPAAFSVAAPLKLDVNNSLFLQQAISGQALADLVDKENFGLLLYEAGVVHRELHGLDVPDLPDLDFEAFLRNLIKCSEWISFFRPEERAFFDGVRDLLLERVPRMDPATFTFCHGDFSCLQVMKNHDSCSVIDFDDCLRSDPYLEIARVMAFLKYDVPLFRNCFLDPKHSETELLEQASAAYLNGYQAKAQEGLNQKRLLWYRICFELHYLARLFKRDLFHRLAFDRSLDIIRNLCESFRQEKEENF